MNEAVLQPISRVRGAGPGCLKSKMLMGDSRIKDAGRGFLKGRYCASRTESRPSARQFKSREALGSELNFPMIGCGVCPMPEGVLAQTQHQPLTCPAVRNDGSGRNASRYNFVRAEFCKRLSSPQAVAQAPCRIA
jgi:hypothetical protein